MITVFGYTAFTFTVGGFASWAPYYFVHVRGIPLMKADVTFGALTVISGVLGSLVGGFISGYYQKRIPNGDILVGTIFILIGIPFTFLAFYLESPWAFYSAMGIAEFFLFASQPAVNVVLMRSVSPYLRGTALAFCVFVIHLLGDLISPPAVGFLSDHLGLKLAILPLPIALFFSVIFYWLSFKKCPNH